MREEVLVLDVQNMGLLKMYFNRVAKGATEFHGSASIKVKSQMKYTNPALTMGSSKSDEYSNKITSAELVKAMCNIYRNNVQ